MKLFFEVNWRGWGIGFYASFEKHDTWEVGAVLGPFHFGVEERP